MNSNLTLDNNNFTVASTVDLKPTHKGKNKGKFSKLSLGQFQNLDSGSTKTESVASTFTKKEEALDTIRVRRPTPDCRYRGTINPNFMGLQYVYINDVRNKILFSQKTISDFNQVGNQDLPLDELLDSMFVEFDQNPRNALDVVDLGKGCFTSYANRRLFMAKKIGEVDCLYGVAVKVHKASEPFYNPEIAKTWGEAVEKRINSNDYIPKDELKTLEKFKGFIKYPIICESRGFVKENQNLSLTLTSKHDLSEMRKEDADKLKKMPKMNGLTQI